jgi:hypothetical protein
LSVGGTATVTDSTFTGCSSSGAPGGAVLIGGQYHTCNATLTNCIFADNTCNDCGGAPAGGAILSDCGNGTLVLEGCKFVVPANTSAGNNDLLADYTTTTFACPPGTKGTPVTLSALPYLINQLPPSAEIVHCA